MVVDISAPLHVTTRALDESSVQVSIAVVAAVRVRRSGELDDATTDIADIVGCGGQGYGVVSDWLLFLGVLFSISQTTTIFKILLFSIYHKTTLFK